MQIDHRYDVVRVLGSGGMGAVYLAIDRLRDGRKVAVKTITDPRTAHWFEREFRLLSRLTHPNLAAVHDFGHDDATGQHYFTAEFVDGAPLEWAGGNRPFEWLLERTVQLCRALAYVHQDGLLHCDVKPENVLVERATGRVRLLDFGVAMATPTGAVLPRGTLPYMAPEWIRGAIPDTRADLYGLGMLLFRVTAGRFPFASDAREDVLRFHLEEPARFPADAPGVPPWWGALVERLLAKDPADRFPSIAAFLRELNLHTGADHRLDTAETWAERLRGGRWIGREAALRAVRGALDEVAYAHALDEPVGTRRGAASASHVTDAPVLLLVEGAPGVGKSRLLLELKRGYQLRRVPVLLEAGAAGTLDALGDSVRCLLGDAAAFVAAPDAAGRTATAGDVDARTRRVEEMGQLLLTAAARDPLVVLLDDAEALDPLTAEVVSYALHAIDYALTRPDPPPEGPPRLVFAAALRTGGAPPASGGARLTALLTHRLARRVVLPELAPTDIGPFLATLLGEQALPDGLEDEVRAATGCNPAAIQALLAYLVERDLLAVEGGALRFAREGAGAEGLPKSLEDALQRVVAGLPEDERVLLAVLSLASEPYPAAILATALDRTEADVTAVLARLEAAGLLVSDPSRDGAPLRLASATLAAVVEGRLSPDERRDMHRRLLGALDGAPPSVATAAARTRHLEAAGEWEKGAATALEAAAEACRSGRFEAALALLGRARAMARGEPATLRAVASEETVVFTLQGAYERAAEACNEVLAQPPAVLPDEERAAWLVRLGDVRMREGSHDAATAALERALDVAPEEDTAAHATIHALRGRVDFFRGAYDGARQHAEAALAAAGAKGAGSLAAGRALNTLGLVEAYVGAPELALQLLRRAEAIFAAHDDRRELAFVTNSLGLVHHRLRDAGAAVAAYGRSLALARELGDQRRETIARMNVSVVYQETGQYREAIDQYLASLERAYRVQDRESLMRIANNLGNIFRFLGRLDDAAGWLGRSLAAAQTLGAKLYLGYDNLILGEVHLLRGEPEAARRRIWEAESLLRDLGRVEAWLEARLDQGVWLGRAKQVAEAEAILGETVTRATTEGLDDHRARALVEWALLGLDTAPPDGKAAAAPAALRRAMEALALLEGRDTPEPRWRVQVALTEAYVALGRATEARHHLGMAAATRAALTERIPAEMRPVFFERSDRRALQDAVDRAATALQSLAPEAKGAPAGLLPAGTSLLSLLEVNKQLNSEHRIERLLNMIMDAVIDLTGAERGFIILRQDTRLVVEVARNIDRESIKKSAQKISHSIAEDVILKGTPVFTYDAMEDERYRDYVSIHALKLRSIVCIPLKDRDSTFGAIYLDNRFQANAFNTEHQTLLEAFAEQAAVAITNARLHERNATILEELKRSRDQVERLNRELEKKLVDQTAMLQETREALTRRQDQLEARYRYGQLIGSSPGIQRVYDLIDRVKEIDVPVIIHGESGTGKELVARAIHFNGKRRKEEFVSINCAAFPETLLESELFGHKRGAFTGADRDKKGLFQVAHRGTLFLDEVGDMSLGMQAKLLRALQESEIRPVGGQESVKVDVRIIAASNQDLKELIRVGKFREDLFYRLNVVLVRIPPLRDRRDDIPTLVQHFLEKIATRTGHGAKSIAPEALKVLVNFGWPGNVRELESTVTTASLFAAGEQIGIPDLANKPELLDGSTPKREPQDLAEHTLDELEREAIIQALLKTKGNKMAAAKHLGISRRSLYNKLKQYDIQLTRKTTVVR